MLRLSCSRRPLIPRWASCTLACSRADGHTATRITNLSGWRPLTVLEARSRLPAFEHPATSQRAAFCQGAAKPPPAAAASAADLVGDALRIAAGVGAFLSFDACVRLAMRLSGLDAFLPTQIGGMLGAFASLSAASCLAPGLTAQLHTALLPGVGWVNRWLPVFLVPVQVMLPTINFTGGATEAAALIAFLSGGWLAALVLSARLVGVLQAFVPAADLSQSPAAAAAPLRRTWRLPLAWLGLALVALPFGIGASQPSWQLAGSSSADVSEPPTASNSSASMDVERAARGLFLAALGAGSYALGLKRGIPGHLCFLLCGASTIIGVFTLGALRGETFEQVVRRDYITGSVANGGSGDFLLWCLSPALVATGVQMFQYRARIRAYSAVLVGSCAAVSLVNILATVALAPVFGVSSEASLAATMRCVTIPMGLPTYARLCSADNADGNMALVALCAGISGFLGFGLSKSALSSALCGAPLGQPVARGIATGTAAHALGSATFAASEPEAFVWGMLAMAVSGVASAAWICSCPPVMDLTLRLAHRSEIGR